MDNRMKKNVREADWKNVLENMALVLLAFYPLRHISWGLDLWDTGYNYANFQYMGTEHMDPMWLFSTYLATAVGNLLTRLPNGGTLFGMNLYTGLSASLLGLLGYFFCTRGLKMPRWIAFAGEFTALSLCWCPTALLYNYLTYILFLGCVILLYYGLTKEKKGCLIGAGVCLGTNVLVRFSNLPEMAMITAVFAYDVILWLEERGKGAVQSTGKSPAQEQKLSAGKEREHITGKSFGMSMRMQKAGEDGRGGAASGFWSRLIAHTGWCLLGYVAAIVVLLGWIQLRYGLDEYAKGISRLFSMTDNATDYKPAAMIMGTVGAYVENLYWAVRIMVIVLCGLLMFATAGFVEEVLLSAKKKPLRIAVRVLWAVVSAAVLWWLYHRVFCLFLFNTYDSMLRPGILFLMLAMLLLSAKKKLLHISVRVLWVAVSAAVLWWLYKREFCSFLFYTYDSMLRPGVLFLMLTMLIGAIRIFHRSSPREEKLISGMLILVIFLTSLGSNNNVYPSVNNLFVAAPYTLWESWRFIRYVKDKKFKYNLIISAFPIKGILTAFLAMCLFQFGLFGISFTFAEATGVQDVSAKVENNEILKNIGMSPQKAQWMTEISAYVEENGLRGKEVILYGNIPALSYYLQMPSAFNPWSNLDSYSRGAMEEALGEVSAGMTEKEAPVIIMDWDYVLYMEEGTAALEAAGVDERRRNKIAEDKKLLLLAEFMEKWGYRRTFDNGKFMVYRSQMAEEGGASLTDGTF